MSIDIVECPSGLKGKVRPLTGRDGKFLTDQKIMRQGAMIDCILGACWLETTDPGPYKLSAGGSIDWGEVVIGDRMAAVLHIHEAGNDDDSPFEFDAQCTNSSCPNPALAMEVYLDELRVQELSEEGRRRLQSGENFETVIPGTQERMRLKDATGHDAFKTTPLADLKAKSRHPNPWVKVPGTGTKVVFKIATGRDERHAQKLAKQKKGDETNKLTASIRMRIVSIEGVEDSQIDEYLDDMPMANLAKLLDRFDEQDCGIDTTVEITCDECGTEQTHELPFDADFFFKRKKRERN